MKATPYEVQVWNASRRRYRLAKTAKPRSHFPSACDEYSRILKVVDPGTKVRLVNVDTKKVFLSFTTTK